MKEILAAVTLAAMTATSPVATGLAEELAPADDTAYEQADFAGEAEYTEAAWEADFTGDETVAPLAEETFAAEEDEPEEFAETEEVVEEVAEPEAPEAAEAMEEAVEEAVAFDETAELPAEVEEMEEAVEPEAAESMDLMAAFDEADMPEVAEAAPEVDRAAMMEQLINEAMDARQNEGINAALDNAFAALAGNAMALANPETGVIEVSGDEIVAMTVNAAQDRFGATQEKTLGAIAAAAARADEMGYIQALGGDARLVSLVSSDAEKEMVKQSRKIAKAGFEAALESIAVANPAFKPFVPLLKALTAYIFDDHFASDPNAKVMAELEKIKEQITQTEQNLKDHTYNVVTLANIGDKYFILEQWADTVREMLGNIHRNAGKTEAQKLDEIAAVYNTTAFQNLMAAMNGATLCFTSPRNDIFGGYNIFDAAYRRACEEVMFSKEAIDISMPYLVSQLACYTAACATMEEVYDAYEQVWGAGSLAESREKMQIRLTGIDLQGQKVGQSVYDLYDDFCNRDKFIFVNKSNNTNIPVKPNVLTVHHFGKRYTNEKMRWNERDLPGFVKNCPLNADQVKALADYVNKKNTLLFMFLAELGFGGDCDGDANESLPALSIYMPTGAQNIVTVKNNSPASGYYTEIEIQINAVQAFGLGATDQKVTLRTVKSGGGSYSNKHSDVHLVVFQPR